MLNSYLKSAIDKIDTLINFTKKDIEDIKKADHQAIFKKTDEKNVLIKGFEEDKGRVDKEILRIANLNEGKNLEEVISSSDKELIEQLKERLNLLKDLNRQYAKLVLGVSEFYNSLLERVVPTEMHGYNRVVSSNSYIQVKV